MIKKLEVQGYIKENTYFYIDEKTRHGFLIDPGAEAGKIIKEIEENDWIIEKILITHGHFDHIGAINEITKKLKIPVYANEKSKQYLENVEYNMSYMFDEDITVFGANYVKDNEIITLKDNKDFYLKMISTPGHTYDSVIYLNEEEKFAFVGDTIFKSSHGRTDLPGGSDEDMKKSLEKILNLYEDIVLYPGHHEATTIKDERRFNSFLNK